MNFSPKIALVFSGGLGLASYHAGAFHAFARSGLALDSVAGSSSGSVAAAIIAGNREDDREAQLRTFWNMPPQPRFEQQPWQHLQGWISAIATHLVGAPGQFHPRLPSFESFSFRSLYDLAPMRDRLNSLIDFGRLNSGEVRICVAATDVETGDPVFFESGKDEIGMDHLLASCGFLPEFAAVEIGGRILVDGGLSVNAPFDRVLEEDTPQGLKLFVIDLYARDGYRPSSLEGAAERKNDLLFGNQTYLRLSDKLALRRKQQNSSPEPEAAQDEIYLLSYRAGASEPGPEKSYNFSDAGIAERWNAGFLDMQAALAGVGSESNGIRSVRRACTKC
jgi:NTE family protein